MSVKLQSQNVFEEIKQRMYFNNMSLGKNSNVLPSKLKRIFSKEERTKIVVEGQSGSLSIDELCKKNGITTRVFDKWSDEFLDLRKNSLGSITKDRKELSDDEKYKLVIEGNNGEYSIAEICRRENITQELFLKWSNDFLQIRNRRLERENNKDLHTFKIRKLIVDSSGQDVLNYFESFIDVTSKETYVTGDTNNCKNVESFKGIRNLVCLSKVNDVRLVNKHFEEINEKLELDGIYIGCMESLAARRLRKKVNKIPIFNELYFGFEFLFKRIIPKLNLTKRLFYNFTKGKDRLMSKAEGLGRLVSCGFKIMDIKSIDGLLYFVVKKVKDPEFDPNPSYGPIYKMPRLGKNGEILKVYKFRTMHPYSEYLQDYILKANGYANTGKPAEDFRIPIWGKIMRRFWLDELPQLINVLKGEMKLVGIRPVSERYFQDIPKEMQKLRLTQKPGCIPPYVALNKAGNVMSVLQSEKQYLQEKLDKPYTTDINYFFRAIFNIVFNAKRSA